MVIWYTSSRPSMAVWATHISVAVPASSSRRGVWSNAEDLVLHREPSPAVGNLRFETHDRGAEGREERRPSACPKLATSRRVGGVALPDTVSVVAGGDRHLPRAGRAGLWE
jgi:hypothetical protein